MFVSNCLCHTFPEIARHRTRPETVSECVCGSIMYGAAGKVVLSCPLLSCTKSFGCKAMRSNYIKTIADILVVVPYFGRIGLLGSGWVNILKRRISYVRVEVVASRETSKVLTDEATRAWIVVSGAALI
jgi:hypothetical protein